MLLKKNPFPEKPPVYVRAVIYTYHFTGIREFKRSGAWWKREYRGIYLSPVSLRAPEEEGTARGKTADK